MSDTESLLPVYHKNANDVLKAFRKTMYCKMQIPFYGIAWVSITIAFFSFIFCVVWSILYNFEEANATHCSVENYLPSISAAIGHFYPQTYVWNATILLQMFPRLKVSRMYLHYNNSIVYDQSSNLCYLVYICNVYELCSLLGLSLVTSTSNYTFHAFCFVGFLFASMLYMILTCYLLKYKRKIPPGNLESRSLKWKFKCCLLNIFCFLMAGYFFRRHNAYCEPRVYSIFAFFEYGVVVSNMFFHLIAIWDFHDKIVTVALTSRGIEVDYIPPFKSVQYNVK